MKDFRDFDAAVRLSFQQAEPNQRHGQNFMNLLYRTRPDLYNMIYRTDLDCFYNDFAVGKALNFVKANWGHPPE